MALSLSTDTSLATMNFSRRPVPRWLGVAIAVFCLAAGCHAEVFAVPQPEKALFGSSDPTMTFLWLGQDTKAVLIFIPGGDGSIGMKPSWPDLRYHAHQTLKRLTNPSLTSGKFDVVIFDSPQKLFSIGGSVSSRMTADHMTRIENTVVYYKAKLGKPVWLMGHSNGSVSITEFQKFLKKKNRENLVDGFVYSGGRNGYAFGADVDAPVLFLHHEKDGCVLTTPSASLRVFNTLKEASRKNVEYVSIKTGEAEANDPCISGYHMYYGAGQEVANAIDQFMLKAYPAK